MIYQNPVIPGFYPDPSVCRVGDDYYLAASSFEYFPGVPIFHSKDLIHWRQLGHALTRPSQLNLHQAACSSGIWAPTLRYHQGLFYLITTNRNTDVNFIVTARDPAGPWSEPIEVDRIAFDPSLFFDEDGKVYYMRRDWELGGTVQAEINPQTGELLSPFRLVGRGFVSEDQEGPHLYKRNGWYYLMAAEGGTRYGHMETIGRSRSVWGPFEPCPLNPILTHRHISSAVIRHTGHGDMVEAHDGSWWMVCLATRHHTYEDANVLGRETFLAPVTWTEDGWPMVGRNGTLSEEMEAKLLPLHPWEESPERDDFDQPELAHCWSFLRNPYDRDWSLSERKGFLRLKGSPVTLSDVDSPAFVGRRQQHHHFAACSLLDFEPVKEGEEAGLCVLARNTYHYEIAVAMKDGVKKLLVRKTVEDIQTIVYEQRMERGPVTLHILGDPKTYAFGYQLGDAPMVIAATGATKLLSNELAEIFTGVFIGLYATGNGEYSQAAADFDWFDYVPKPAGKLEMSFGWST